MESVVVIIHVFIAVALVGMILLQKTEGNASGAGFSGGASVESMMRPRARPNPMGRATAILGICFFATSLTLAVMSKPAHRQNASFMAEPSRTPAVPKVDETPSVPKTDEAPAPAAPTAPSSQGPVVPNK